MKYPTNSPEGRLVKKITGETKIGLTFDVYPNTSEIEFVNRHFNEGGGITHYWIVRLAPREEDIKAVKIPTNHPAFDKPDAFSGVHKLETGQAVIAIQSSGGKKYARLYLHDALLLESKIDHDLTHGEKIVLKATQSYIASVRKHEAIRLTKISSSFYDDSKSSLIEKKLLTQNGGFTAAGKIEAAKLPPLEKLAREFLISRMKSPVAFLCTIQHHDDDPIVEVYVVTEGDVNIISACSMAKVISQIATTTTPSSDMHVVHPKIKEYDGKYRMFW